MITIKITDDMLKSAQEFAEKKAPTRYRRLSGDINRETDIARLYIGKLGDLVGQEGLYKLEIANRCLEEKLFVSKDKFFKDRGDSFIFPDTPKQKVVDFKAAWRSFHIRILVPDDQVKSQPKDMYIGVRLDIDNKIGEVIGFVTLEELKTRHEPQSFGEKRAFWVFLDELHPIEELKKL